MSHDRLAPLHQPVSTVPVLGPAGDARPVVVLAAPRAGSASAGVAGRVVAALCGHGHPVTVVPPGSAEQAREAAVALLGAGDPSVDPRPAALVVVGGDGTVQLGAHAAAGTDVPLFVVPAGSGNDAARALGVARLAPERAAARLGDLLAHGATPRRVDVMSVRSPGSPARTVVSVVAAGFDAAVNARANAWAAGPAHGAGRTAAHRLPPRARYSAAVLAELPAWRPRPYRLVLDGVAREVQASLVAIANTTSYGGGMRIAPRARADDGLLDVVVAAALGRAGLLALLPTAFAGLHTAHPSVSVHRAARVGLDVLDDGAHPLRPHGDGEELAPAPLDVRVLPGALALLT